MTFHRASRAMAVGLVLAAAGGPVRVWGAVEPASQDAGNYPTRAVTIIVSAPPGGGLDVTARVVANRLTQMWGQPFVVENRPGAGGNLGTRVVAAAKPDGYTLLAAQSAPLTVNAILYKDLGYDPSALEPIAIMTTVPNALFVTSSLPAGSVAELIAYAKANPGKVNFGSQGIGTKAHLLGEFFARVTGTKLTHVPYRGTMQAANDLIAGHVDMVFFPIDALREQYQARQAKMLAVTALERVATVPEVPTMGEAGIDGMLADAWNALAAPPKTPAAIVSKLNRAVNAVLTEGETAAHLGGLSMTPVGGTPDDMKTVIADETARWSGVIRSANITLD